MAVSRPSSRVLVLDPAGRILMLGIVLPTEPRTIWVPPGGGAEPGEDPCDTARRELLEETRLAVSREDLGPPIAHTSGRRPSIDGVLLDVDQTFFAIHVEGLAPESSGFTPLERDVVHEFRWWTADAIDATEDLVYPFGLADLVRRVVRGDVPVPPLELPWPTT